MSWKSKLHLTVIFSLLPFVASGCWDKIEVRELGIVMGMGLDYIEGSQPVQLTLQTVKPNGLQGGENMNGQSSKQFETIVSRGETVFDAFHNIQITSNKKIILPHSKLVVIGKQLAERGIADVSDYLLRDRQIRPTSWIVIADTTAKEMLESDLGLGAIPSAGLVTMLESLKETTLALPINLIQYFMRMQGDTEVTIAPVIQKSGNRVVLENTAVFDKDRMIGTLSLNETRGFIWLRNKLVIGDLTLPFNKDNSKLKENVSVDISKGTTKITPHFQAPDKITMEIKCTGLAHIRDAEMTNQVLFAPERIEELEQAVEELLTSRIQHTIDVAQKKIKADFIGFEDKFHNTYPQDWQRLHAEWDSIFPTIQTKITVQIEIDRQGITKNPLEL